MFTTCHPSSWPSSTRSLVGKVEQDYLRRVILREHDTSRSNPVAPTFISTTARTALDLGYHVVLEGILHTERYATVLHTLIAEHPSPSHVYYLDVSFAETVRRHYSRAEPIDVTPEQMRDWYTPRTTRNLVATTSLTIPPEGREGSSGCPEFATSG